MRRWIIRAGHLEHEVLLAHQRLKTPIHLRERDPVLARQLIDRFAGDPLNLQTLRQMLRLELFEDCSGLDDRQVLAKVAKLLLCGRIVIEALPDRPVSPTSEGFLRVIGPATEMKEKRATILDDTLTWIAIELVDTEGEPVAHVAYKILRPDGSVVDAGTLNENGHARVEGIKPGQYQVSFPGLDQQAWSISAA